MGIEPTHKGFADLSLTTWVPRLNLTSISNISLACQSPQTPVVNRFSSTLLFSARRSQFAA